MTKQQTYRDIQKVMVDMFPEYKELKFSGKVCRQEQGVDPRTLTTLLDFQHKTMTKPKWQERLERCMIQDTVIAHSDYAQALNKTIENIIIPIIAEEMQKQREAVIDECAYAIEHWMITKGYETEETVFDRLQALKKQNHE